MSPNICDLKKSSGAGFGWSEPQVSGTVKSLLVALSDSEG